MRVPLHRRGLVALLAVGWALVLWPHLPEGFLYQTGLDPSRNDGFLSALYVSMTTLTTLGYGDIVPTSPWLRVLQPLQALTGFAVLTVSVTWLLSIYPVLSRCRALARDVHDTRESEPETGNLVEGLGPDAVTELLGTLASRLVAVRGDLEQFPITYYFHENDDRSALSSAVPYLVRLAERAADEDRAPGVRLRAATLRAAIRDLSSTLGSSFLGLPSAPVGRVLEAYARDHLRAPRG